MKDRAEEESVSGSRQPPEERLALFNPMFTENQLDLDRKDLIVSDVTGEYTAKQSDSSPLGGHHLDNDENDFGLPSSDETTPTISHSLTTEDEVVSSLPVPPDGGWGWVVLAASFLCNAMVDGMASCFGVLLPHLVAYYGASTSKTALVGSIMIGSFLGAGPLVGVFVNYFGGRVSAMFGAGLASAALLISILSPSINVLILTFGLLGGIGICFFYIPAMVMVGFYFERRRAMAMGISCSGAGIGMLIFAPLTAYFLEIYDWKNTVILLAGILMQVLVLGALMRPLTATKIHKNCPPVDSDHLQTGGDLEMEIASENGNEDSDYQTGSEKSNGIGNSSKDKTTFRCHPFHKSLHTVIGDEAHHSKISNTQREVSQSLRPRLLRLRPEEGQAFTRSCDFGVLYLQSSLGVVDASKLLVPTAAECEVRTLSGKPNWYSCHHLPDSTASHMTGLTGPKQGHSSTILRREVVYSDSVHALPEYKAQPDQFSNLSSMLDLPKGDDASPTGTPPSRASICSNLGQMLDPTVFAHPAFIILALAAVFIQLGYFIPIVYMTEYAATLGIDTGRSAVLISIMGVSNMVGRAGAGALANVPRVNALHLCNVSLLITGGSTLLAISFCRGYLSLVCYSFVFGLSIAAFVPLTSIFLVQYIGLHKLTNAFGLLSLVRGISCVAGPPIAGAILDSTFSFHAVFYFAGAMFIIAAIIQYFLPCSKRWHKSDLAPAHA